MRGRGRSTVSQARWKHDDPHEYIARSKSSGSKAVEGGGRRGSAVDDVEEAVWVWADEELLPTGPLMCSARKATFDERWPYTGRRGWKPTSNKVCVWTRGLWLTSQLSEAGFHYTPTDDELDGCTCVYCGVELGGWERGDDPMCVQPALDGANQSVTSTSGGGPNAPSSTACQKTPWMRAQAMAM